MKVVSASVELLWITQDPEQQIEAAGRTCYKSEDKITPESAGKFVDKLRKSGHHAMLEHAVASFRIITDRGITHEIVRHRLASYAQESTRYCNYSKDKFDNECSFIQPPGLNFSQAGIWKLACSAAEVRYFEMLKEGCTPQIARSVLPNCLKTEIVMMANLREWRHFIKLRGSAAAHPQIRPVAYGIWNILKDHAPNVFNDLSPLSLLAPPVVD
ncbi:MAG: FAD-dependent thymidylate synthase [Proteobacteria bacterium]|nr:FAD-dependent thymidylate synthase [Pseudomonadota bacterium]